MISLDVDLVQVGTLITKMIKAGLIASRHRQIYNQIAAVAEKYEDVFSSDTPVQVMNPEALTEAELRALLYTSDQTFIEAAISAIGIKYQAIIKVSRDILSGRFSACGVSFEPSFPPITQLQGKGIIQCLDSEMPGFSIEALKLRDSLPFDKSTTKMQVLVPTEEVLSEFSLEQFDIKERFLIEEIAEQIRQSRATLQERVTNEKGEITVFVTLSATARREILKHSLVWEADHSYYRGYLFWLDTGISTISTVEGAESYQLCAEWAGKMPSFKVMTHMVANSHFKERTMLNLRSYLNAHRLRYANHHEDDVVLPGLKGIVSLMRDEKSEEWAHDLELKQIRVSAILDAAGIRHEFFTAWGDRSRLSCVIWFERDLKSYGNQMRSEVSKYTAFVDSELEHITGLAQGKGRRKNFRRGRRLEDILSLGIRNKALFLERMRTAVSMLEFPEVNQLERKMPFRKKRVDWYSEWLLDFQETNCVRRAHIKGEQLQPIVFVGDFEDLLVLGDGRAVCIIVKGASAKRRSRFRSLVSETATTHNVLYGTFILSRITGMDKELSSILGAGKSGLHMLVKSTERLTREVIRSNKEVSVMDIEHQVDLELSHLDNKSKETVTRTVIDLLMSGPVSPAVETWGSISSCYIDAIHEHRVESRGTLVLDNLVPLGGTKVWASVGEINLTASRTNRSKAVQLSRKPGNRWHMWEAVYIPPKDDEYVADSSMRCG